MLYTNTLTNNWNMQFIGLICLMLKKACIILSTSYSGIMVALQRFKSTS